MRRLLLPASIALLLAGCVKAPPRVEPDLENETPDSWTARDEDPAEPADEWWHDFGDPHLDELIRTALAENRDLLAAASRVERAEAEAKIAGADLKPQIGVGLNASRTKQNFIGFPIPGSEGQVPSTTTTRLGLSLDVSWEIDLWGRMKAGARAAVADLQATEFDLRAARQSIAAQTAKIWFAVAEAGQQVELARTSADSFRDVAAQVRSRYEQGLRPALDLRLALSNWRSAEAFLALRQRQLDLLLRQLEVLLGRYPSATLLDRYPARELPALPGPVPVGLPAEIVARRPDLQAAERRLAAADQRYLQARRSLYPRLSLTATGGSATVQLQDLLKGDFGVWSIAANLAQPLFQGGKLRAGVSRADAIEDEVLALFSGRVLGAYAEVETALAAEQYLLDREKALAEAATQLNAARRLAEDRYASGLGQYIVVLDSQTRAVVAESEWISVRRELLANRIDLHLALGGDFETPAVGEEATR